MAETEDLDTTTAPAAPTLALPLALEPERRNPGGAVARAYRASDGKLVLDLDIEEGHVTATNGLHVDAVIVAVYDGDDGELMMLSLARRETRSPLDRAATVLEALMADAKGDPDQRCPGCDEDVKDGDAFRNEDAHPECALANTIGHIGHFLDHDFWCENMGDQTAGRGQRASALAVAALVEECGGLKPFLVKYFSAIFEQRSH